LFAKATRQRTSLAGRTRQRLYNAIRKMLRKDILTTFSVDESSASAQEVARFSRLAEEWWKPDGAFKVVHRFNEARLSYLMEILPCVLSDCLTQKGKLAGLKIVDVGCGAGLVAEPLARAGASVVGIDPSGRNIEIARTHQRTSGTDVDYRHMLPEQLARSGERFDVVLCLEVVEHVADVPLFLESCARLVAPNGLLVMATLNRSLKSFLFGIVGAEYVLRLLPQGTHDWRKFISPDELERAFKPLGLKELERTGMSFNPFRGTFHFSDDVSINYIQLFRCAEPAPALSSGHDPSRVHHH
jgi:2-polyprenyl-6-hydroxyphenyl methylase/3-demethylubiquinone-9 3-methyltransferase